MSCALRRTPAVERPEVELLPSLDCLRLGEDVYEEFREAAAAERRFLSNLIETAALAWVRETQFADDAEAEEILSDDALVQRMKTGSRQARRHEGSFADDACTNADPYG